MEALRFIVPFGFDGASDRAARRYVAERGPAGVSIRVENVPGAGGLNGLRLANALARGGEPVLLLGTPTTHVLLPARLGEAEAPLPSFAPIASLGSAPNVLLASPRLGFRSVAELVEAARRRTLTYASAGVGQTIHLCTALFCEMAGIRMEHRPYDAGSATAYADLVAGTVHVYFDNALACDEMVARGEAVPLAVSSLERWPGLPDTPTLAECGYPEHALDVWLGVFGHGVARWFPARDERLAQAVARSPGQWRRALEAAGFEVRKRPDA